MSNNPVVDGIMCWIAWPEGTASVMDATDMAFQANALANSKTYMAAVSPLFFTHYSYKNSIWRSDNDLMGTRWPQLINMNPQPDFIQISE